MKKLKVLDLFSGLGGFSLGLERTGHFETVAFCDNNKFSKAILNKHWKGIKIYDDVRAITKENFETDGIETPDIITGGFPCQPFSVAGKQKGTDDDRHLWPEMFRIIKVFQPKFVIGENVPGIVNIQDGVVFETVCTNLEDEGYEVQPFNIPAAAVGAPHQRKRIWFIAVRSDVGNSEHNGSFTDKIGRRNEEINGGTQERQNRSVEFKGTSRSEDNAAMENPNNNGFEGGFSETRNQINSRETSTINRIENTDNSSRRSNGRGDQSQPKIDGEVQRLRDGNEEESSRTTGVRGLYERTNISEGIVREDRNYKDDNRTLVQTRQSRVQSSEHRGLGKDQTSLDNNQIQQGDDNTTLNRMERGDKDNVADTNDEGVRTRIGGSDNDYETESRSWRADGTRGSSDVERHNSTSTEVEGMDVADTESIRTREFRHSDQTQGREGSSSTQLDGSSSEMADTNGEGLEGFRQSRSQFNETSSSTSSSEERQRTMDQGWWSVEPNVGRVANGVSGRVHRLRGLGNSIVPQIVEEIGYAIIKAMK